MKKSLTSFVAGFILAALLFSSSNLQAQGGLPKDVNDYLNKSAAWTERMRSDYKAANDFFFNKAPYSPAKNADDDLGKLITEINEFDSPLVMRAIHAQLVFAADRCRNHTSSAANVKDIAQLNAFHAAVIIPQREACATQIQAAKLMILEAGIAGGIDPYEK